MPTDRYVMTLSDWKTKHDGCIATYKGSVVEVKEFSAIDSDTNIEVLFKKLTEGKRYTYVKTPAIDPDINWDYPETGFVFYDNQAILLERKSRGVDGIKYRQSLHPAGLNITFLSYDELQYLNKLVPPKSLLLYSELWKPTHFSIHDGANSILRGDSLSVPVSLSYALKLSFMHNRVLLYKNRYPVGYYSDGCIMLFDKLEFLKEDVESLGINVVMATVSSMFKV